MKIVVNALSVYSGGGLTSMINLLPALGEVDQENEYIVIVSAKQEAVLKGVPEPFGVHKVAFDPKSILARLLYEQLVMPFVLWRLGAEWLYSVGNLTTLLAPCRILLLIENANPYSVLDVAWSKKERLRHWALRGIGALSARRAAVIRFLSERSRHIICDMTGIPIRKTTVIPHGVAFRSDQSGKGIDDQNLPSRFILTVSNVGPHKNLHTLVEAFAKLIDNHRYPGSLVIAGAKLYPEYYRLLMSTIGRSRLESKVMFLDWVDPEVLPLLYRRAELFVFPSAEETFGIPVVEAMGYGVPVVVPSSGNDGTRYFIPYEELCHSAAQYFDVFESSGLCEQMNNVLTDEQRRKQMIVAGREIAERYRWDVVAAALVDVFRGVSIKDAA
jgi:glycosyltransferase involved in cell wall biosynthesis